MKTLASLMALAALTLGSTWAQDTAPSPVAPQPAATAPAVAAPETPAPAAEAPAPAADTSATAPEEPEALVPAAAAAISTQATPPVAEEAGVQPAPIAAWEAIVFCIVVIGVIFLGIWKSREPKDANKEKSASDYFLAGRGLTWWLVGFSLIAANISTEQFVGMSGQAADWLGMSIAGYEWLAAIVLVFVAFFFLPKLLRGGVYTIPEFLEYRYNTVARTIMAICTLMILVGVPTAGVIYAGAKVISVFFAGYSAGGIDFGNIMVGCVIIAFCASVYVFVGGLKACAWTDLIWGAGLIIGGGVVAYLVMQGLADADPNHLIESASATSDATVASLKDANALERLYQLNAGVAADGVNGAGGKLHMIRPASDSTIPWTVYLMGLWIPNFFYWGLNQYIMQRTLASKSLAEGQLGIVFAAFLKLLIPFVVVIPGILAYNLYREDLRKSAYGKQTEAIQKVGDMIDKTVMHIDASLLMAAEPEAVERAARPGKQTQIEFAEKAILNNAKLVGADTANLTVGQDEQGKTVTIDLPRTLAELRADINDERTTKRERIEKIAPVIAANNVFVEKAKEKGIPVSSKLTGFDYDSAFPTLLKNLMPGTGLTWFVLAALFGAVVSSLASMLNSASTIFTMDIYNKLRKQASATELVNVGKIGVVVCVLIALGIAVFLSDKIDSIFQYIQEFQGYISPGVLCVFLFGFFVPKCPRFFGWLGIALNVVLYGSLAYFMPDLPFLNRMSVCLIVIATLGALLTWINAARGGEAIVLPAKNEVSLQTSTKAKAFGWFVVAATIALYVIFW